MDPCQTKFHDFHWFNIQKPHIQTSIFQASVPSTLRKAEDLMPRDIMSSEPRHWMVFGQWAMPVQSRAEAPTAGAKSSAFLRVEHPFAHRESRNPSWIQEPIVKPRNLSWIQGTYRESRNLSWIQQPMPGTWSSDVWFLNIKFKKTMELVWNCSVRIDMNSY